MADGRSISVGSEPLGTDIGFEPGCEIHRRVRGRHADIRPDSRCSIVPECSCSESMRSSTQFTPPHNLVTQHQCPNSRQALKRRLKPDQIGPRSQAPLCLLWQPVRGARQEREERPPVSVFFIRMLDAVGIVDKPVEDGIGIGRSRPASSVDRSWRRRQRSCAALAVRGNPRSPKVKETVGAFVQACVGPFPPAVGAYRRRRPNRWVLLTYEWRRRWISEWTVDGFASGLGLLLAHKLAEDSTSRLPHGTGRVNPPLA